MSSPLRLTDEQITTIMALARPLTPNQRSAFLEMLATKLDGRGELGDGQIYRACRELLHHGGVWQAPMFSRDEGGKYDRVERRGRRIEDVGEDDRPHRKVQPRTLGAL